MSTGMVLLLTALGWLGSFGTWSYFEGRRVDAERIREWGKA